MATASASGSVVHQLVNTEPRLSVLIATRNRCEQLEKTLASIADCTDPDGIAWEIVVVDNGSTDDTSAVVQRFAARARVHVVCVEEPRQGKGRALNTGIRACRGEWILFTDDDVRVDPDWLRAVVHEYNSDPGLVGVGGRVELFDPDAARVAVRPSRSRRLISQEDLHPRSIPIIGCNMSVRRAALEEIGGFDEALGPGSPAGAVAEDLDVLYRLTAGGRHVIYAPEVLVRHDHQRSSRDDLTPIRRGYARGRGAFYWKHGRVGGRRIRKVAYQEARSLLVRLLRRSGQPGPIRMGWWVVSGAVAYARGSGPSAPSTRPQA